MKKLMSILLGLTLVAGTAVIGFAGDEPAKPEDTKQTKKKKGGKKKAADKKDEAPK